jgi:hypothetical protein
MTGILARFHRATRGRDVVLHGSRRFRERSSNNVK